jgi:lysophospholipase L1-like esterase
MLEKPLVRREDPPKRHRRGRLDAVLALVVGTITVLASSQLARGEAAAGLAVIHERSAAVGTVGTGEAPANAGRKPQAPSRDVRAIPFVPSRPHVVVPQSAPQVVVRVTPGATAVFLGDSYSTGWKGAGIGSHGWPAIVSAAQGWHAINLAVAGTGFINPGWTNQPLGARVSEAIRQRPDVVFIATGHNDSRWSAAATGRAADEAIDRLHHALPDAQIVILAPIWPSGSAPSRCLQLRDHLRRTAASVGAIFIDPLAEGWFGGGNRRYIGADGIHPTDAGHRAMADRVLAALARAG